MAEQWYLINSNHDTVSGFESDDFDYYTQDAFREALESSLGDDIKICRYDMEVLASTRAIPIGGVSDTKLKSTTRQLLLPIGTCQAGQYIYYEDKYWLIVNYVDNNKVYEKAIIHSKSNTDREDKNYKKRKNKLESPEKVDENFTYSKIEQIPNNKFSKKIKGKTKQLSATREYNRASPKYSIEDPNDGIKEIKHSSSTSKYILHKFKKEKEKENNSKNIDEDLLFIKPSKKEDNKINYKNKSENKRENTNKKIKKIQIN